MNIIKRQPNKSRSERGYPLRKFCNLCVYTGLLMLLVCIASLTLIAEEAETEADAPVTNDAETQTTENSPQETATVESTDSATANSGGADAEVTKEKITGTANKMERYDKEGITILIGEAKTVRYNEQDVEIGFLNADKITLKTDPETDTTTEIVAEGNVEIRDQDIFATCDHAIMNNLTNTITLKENVVVLQNKDRLETKLFTFNRITGKQTGEGGVKFKVTVTQVAPVSPETDENTENGEDADAEETSTVSPEDADAQTNNADETAEEKPEADPDNADDAGSEDKTDTDTGNGDAAGEKPEADADNADDTDSEEETDTDTENSDDADTNAETEESEDN